MITIERYKNSRHWAVRQGDRLLAVVCYKKGAATIRALLSAGPAGRLIDPSVELRADLGAIARLAHTLNRRIAQTLARLDEPPG